jgi:putative endonuclease
MSRNPMGVRLGEGFMMGGGFRRTADAAYRPETAMDPGFRRDDNLKLSLYPRWRAEGGAMRDHGYFVYILASRKSGTLYIGVTEDLERRLWQHRQHNPRSFTSRYKVHRLVWFEEHADITAAIAREKALKEWQRAWKIQLIEKDNPDWSDLSVDWWV